MQNSIVEPETDITLEILFIVFLTLLNGVFAMAEIALVSARKARLQKRAEAGDKAARRALDLAERPEEFLSTVQVGITMVGVLAGAFGGATIAQELATVIVRYESLAEYAESIAVGIVVLGVTYLSLIIGELVPKRIALTHAESIASAVAAPMRALSRITTPVIWLLNASTNALLWVLRVKPAKDPQITEEEIRIIIRQGTEAGVIDRDEQSIVERVFRLGARRASTLMTPRKELVVLFVSDSTKELREKIASHPHSLFPVCDGNLGNVLGVVRSSDLLAQVLSHRPIDLRYMVREPLVVPETIPSFRLLADFRSKNMDTALLLDEYGGLQGLITATDVLRGLVGDVSFLDMPRISLQKDGSWSIDGLVPIDEFRDTLKLPTSQEEEDHSYNTAGGWIMGVFGRIPQEGDEIERSGYTFVIVDMDGLRIDKIKAIPIPRAPIDGASEQ